MKKIFLLSILVMFLTGCTSIQNSKLEDLIDNIVTSKVSTKNIARKGYQYYLPKGLFVKKSTIFNEVLRDQKYQYYLYVDIVSYHNKIKFNYTENENAYYSKGIHYNDKSGYIEINNYKNNQYLIEIMYNYAKIEVIVFENEINQGVSYAMSVLSSIAYNDNVIDKYLSNSVLDTVEENFDIFEIIGSDNYLEFTEDTGSHGEDKHDPDYIN